MTDDGGMEPGQKWAYRARRDDPLVEVEVLRLGIQNPARVLVAFVPDSFEGQQEWVSPARLKTLWRHVQAFEARENRWDAAMSPGLPQDDPREYAAEVVFAELIPGELAWFGYFSKGGIITIADVEALAEFLSIQPKQLRSHPNSFAEDGHLIAPWGTTELVVSTAARNDPQPILVWVDSEERQARQEAIHGRTTGGSSPFFIEPQDCFAYDEKHAKPARQLLRRWCGDETERFDELVELRKEIRRVGEIAQEAVDLLTRSNATAATRLRAELGVPVEMLQPDRGADRR